MSSWYAAGVIYRRVRGRLEFLVIDIIFTSERYKHTPMQTKFVGGKSNKDDKVILDTLRREIMEETDLILRDFYTPNCIHEVNKKTHSQKFYLIPFEVLSGMMRTEILEMEGEQLSPPYWLAVEPLGAERVFVTHQAAFNAAVKKLSGQAV